MRLRTLICTIGFLLFSAVAFAASTVEIKGVVTDAASKQPLAGVVLKVDDGALWVITDIDGAYSLKLADGAYLLKTDLLGYVSQLVSVTVVKGNVTLKNAKGEVVSPNFALDVESLALEEVTVTAQRPAGTLGTSHSIGKEALEHLQMTNVSDMQALLPGGKTVNPDLTQDNTFALRSGGTDAGNAAFGTAVEIDGVRMSSNAGLAQPTGVDTRTIAVENIESVEVITGVPSAEYGDLNSGMVKINTKKGRTPVNISFSINPKTYQAAVSKGFDLQKDKGVLNVSGEWARSTSKLTSPYTAYTRGNVGLTYSNTFKKVLRFELGGTVNIGGMNSKDDPDANSGNTSSARDNIYRLNTMLNWMLNKNWITSLKLEASVSMNDNLARAHTYYSSATTQPAIHAEEAGYHWADQLPLNYYSDQIVDSKELDIAAALKYDWTRSWGKLKNRVKAGVQFKSNGNVGKGEYYENPALAPNGYRPRPYTDYPFMNNLSEYIEDQLTLPIGSTTLDITAGLRFEQVFLEGTQYKHKNTVSPRFNAKWAFGKHFTLRGGWGISEKLPSFYVLYPKQEYRDVQTFAFTSGTNAYYAYCTSPYMMEYNPELKWQRNQNSELGMDFSWGKWKMSVVGFYNITENPYQYLNTYTPVTYRMSKLPDGYTIPADPQLKVDSQTGIVYMRGADEEYWTPMETKVIDQSFVKSTKQTNGKPVYRAGAELIVDFPEIRAIRTSFRLDASYTYSSYVDDNLSAYYNYGWSDLTEKNRSYKYVGFYARGNSTSTVNGKITHNLDANLTAITHIPQAKIVITCRFEASILKRSRNLSQYNGSEYAYNVSQSSTQPTGGSIYDGNSYAAIRPVYYMDVDGNTYPFTDAQATDPAFANLIVKTGNQYVYNLDGYDFYCSANLSVTKEIGKHVALSFFANNFTASRPSVTSLATGVSAVFTPSFYYGLTCRLKW